MYKTKLTRSTDRQAFKQALFGFKDIIWQPKPEQYCEYRLDGIHKSDPTIWVRAKQYTNGTLMLDGSSPEQKARLTDLLPVALRPAGGNNPLSPGGKPVATSLHQLSGIVIGSDESGKGDYFGPLVIAAVLITDETGPELKKLGVMDSKQLTDPKMAVLSTQILEIVGEQNASIITITPVNYNAWTDKLKARGQNLNHLLAWGHAEALETVLNQSLDCHDLTQIQAVADQFGNEKYLQAKLQEKGKAVRLLQTPRAEAHVAVAAASILARHRFVSTVAQLSERFGMTLPLGAGPLVLRAGRAFITRHGREALINVAKLHFKTTQSLT